VEIRREHDLGYHHFGLNEVRWPVSCVADSELDMMTAARRQERFELNRLYWQGHFEILNVLDEWAGIEVGNRPFGLLTD